MTNTDVAMYKYVSDVKDLMMGGATCRDNFSVTIWLGHRDWFSATPYARGKVSLLQTFTPRRPAQPGCADTPYGQSLFRGEHNALATSSAISKTTNARGLTKSSLARGSTEPPQTAQWLPGSSTLSTKSWRRTLCHFRSIILELGVRRGLWCSGDRDGCDLKQGGVVGRKVTPLQLRARALATSVQRARAKTLVRRAGRWVGTCGSAVGVA